MTDIERSASFYDESFKKEGRISERIFLFPMIVPPDKPEKKMALIVKNRFFKEE